MRILFAEKIERNLDGVVVELQPRQKHHQDLCRSCSRHCGIAGVNFVAEVRNSGVDVASRQRLEKNGVIVVEIFEGRVCAEAELRR